MFRARVVDLAPHSLIMEITGAEDKIDALVEVLRPFGILEMVRTGQVVMTRGMQERREPIRQPQPRGGDLAAQAEQHGSERSLRTRV